MLLMKGCVRYGTASLTQAWCWIPLRPQNKTLKPYKCKVMNPKVQASRILQQLLTGASSDLARPSSVATIWGRSCRYPLPIACAGMNKGQVGQIQDLHANSVLQPVTAGSVQPWLCRSPLSGMSAGEKPRRQNRANCAGLKPRPTAQAQQAQ